MVGIAPGVPAIRVNSQEAARPVRQNGRMPELTYTAVGATRDLARVPKGFRPLERRAVIGNGGADFEAARNSVVNWGLQTGSGMTVEGLKTAEVGDTVRLAIPVGPFRVHAPARVVYLVDEPGLAGFAYGTLPGHPECGEEAFLVELGADGVVSIVIRAFSRPANWFWWLGAPALRLAQEVYTRRYLRALRQ
jgi:uncharacterized protein (UPF0548 family)